MTPRNIKNATHAMCAPKNWDAASNGECDVLYVRKWLNTFESAWYPTAEELALLNAGEPVILTTFGFQPPVSLNVREEEKMHVS